jgi:peptidoglycan/LPS O-acetylase OafA/YrhL
MDKSAWAESANGTLSAQPYRSDIDGLRAVAVSAVIAYHFWNDLLPGGFLGVDMFFVISGHVITTSLSRHAGSIHELFLDFYCRRIKRLLPALLACVTVTSLIGSLFIHPQSAEYSDSMKAGLFAVLGLSNIYFFRESSDYFGNLASLNLFTHTWSLGVEEQFYIAFPLLFLVTGYASRQPGRRLLFFAAQGVLTLASFALYVWLNRRLVSGAYFLMPSRAWELGVGSMTALAASYPLRSGGPALGPAAGTVLSLIPWLSAAMIAAALVTPVDLQLYATPAVVAGAAALIMTLHPGRRLHRLLTVPSVLLVGVLSYSLYLWHWSVLAVARWTVGVHWWTAPFLLAAIGGLAAASYAFVERPLRRAKWSASSLLSAGYGLTAIALTVGLFLILQKALNGVFYIGAPAALAAKGSLTLKDDKFHAGVLEWSPADCVLSSNNDVGKDIDAGRCALRGTPNPASARRFVVIGNSFSVAEFEMYAALAEDGLGSVIATSSWGASPVRELTNESPWSEANDYYWDSIVPALISRLTRGDIVVMINDLHELVPATTNAAALDRLALFRSGLLRLADGLHRKDIQIVFQSQNPFLREAQCTPDMAKPQWFANDELSRCRYYSKARSITRIRPLLDVLEDVQRARPNFHILDLFPVMCPGDVCGFYNAQGTFLYRDEFSHPSIEANYLARPALLSVVNQAIASQQR